MAEKQIYSGGDCPVPYYQFPKSLMSNKKITAKSKLVYMELFDKAKQSASIGQRVNSEGIPYAEIGIRTLANNLEMSDRTIKDAIKVLEEQGYIQVSHGNYDSSKGKNECNRYYIYI